MRAVSVLFDTEPLAVPSVKADLVENLVRLVGAVLGVQVFELVAGVEGVIGLWHGIHLFCEAEELDLIDRVPVDRKP